jgi:hypothetical protein
MQVLHVKKYNELQTAKWQKDCQQARAEGRHYSMMPQLAFYVFNKNYGYVAFDGKKALWDKTKKGVMTFWESEEQKKKVRGW